MKATTNISSRLKDSAAARVLFALGMIWCMALVAQADIAQRGTATTASNSGNAVTINKPTGVVQGDVMIVTLAQRNSAGTPAAATSPGWTAVKSGTLGSSTALYGSILYRVAGAGESTSNSYAFTLTATVGGAVGDIVAFSGVDTNNPLDVAAASLPAFAQANSATVTATAISTVTPNAVAIMFGMGATNTTSTGGTWSGWAAGLTEIFDNQGTGTGLNASSVGAAWKTNAAAGTTGGGTATLSKTMRQAGLWVALRPLILVANATNSTVSAAPASALADGVATSTITVTVRDDGSNAISGKAVTLASSRGATDSISAASGVSSGAGVVTFAVSSTTTGPAVFTATVTNDSVVITPTATVTFTASTNKDVLTFGTGVAGSSAAINTNAATVAWVVPYGTDVTSLAADYTVSPAASGSPVSGTFRNFTSPQTYTVTAQDLSTKIYTVTTTVAAPSTNRDILTFTFPTYGVATITGTNITLTVPAGSPVTSLAPTYTVSALAAGAPASGTTRNFSTPQTYTVTAQNGSTKIYLVTVTVTTGPQTYAIAASTDLAQEFSPMNASGHPVIMGLTNYPNSVAPKALTALSMKAPWTAVGVQTMMCSDCHDATTTNYVPGAAQGPHGSANQFMLRGPNAQNWPVATNFVVSWCSNCHNDTASFDGSHWNHHSVPGSCYSCHIVVPHGGKLSRLIADGNSPNMPSRYAYNNDTNNVQITGFTKSATLSQSSCGAKCDTGTHPLANGGQW